MVGLASRRSGLLLGCRRAVYIFHRWLHIQIQGLAPRLRLCYKVLVNVAKDVQFGLTRDWDVCTVARETGGAVKCKHN